MNYSLVYSNLIEASKGRSLDGYFERHHIIPRCLGGTDEFNNLVDLTAREHFVAHLLLMKMYPTEGKLTLAVRMMTASSSGQVRNNHEYEWVRKRVARVTSSMMKEIASTLKHKAQFQKNIVGDNHPAKKLKNRVRMSTFMKEYMRTHECPSKKPENRKKLSKRWKINNPMWKSENKEKTSFRMRGHNAVMPNGYSSQQKNLLDNFEKYYQQYHVEQGIPFSKISVMFGFKSTTFGAYAAKLGLKNLRAESRVACPHCGKEGTKGNIVRWHFDHCKLKVT